MQITVKLDRYDAEDLVKYIERIPQQSEHDRIIEQERLLKLRDAINRALTERK